MDIVLASRSPRRKELLKKVFADFEVLPGNVDESEIKETDPVEFALTAAILKAKDVANKYPSALVIGSDTVVALGNKIFGKPKDREHAKDMLKALSGARHKVITGVALYKKDEDKLVTGYELTYVVFKDLSDKEIDDYLGQQSFSDKAGSYAIQDIGEKFVVETKGDHDNVVGFPVERFKKLLKKFESPEYEVEIIDIALPNNYGVAKLEGGIVFVPGLVMDDKAKIRIVKEEKRFSYGEVSKMVLPSPLRDKPQCPHFGPCGGCIFQHLKYGEQLKLKEKYLWETVRRLGGIDLKNTQKEAITPSPDIYYYRNKMEFAFGSKLGEVVLGLRERSSPVKKTAGKIVALSKCLIFNDKVEKLLPIFTGFARENSLMAYNPLNRKGFLRHLVVLEGKNTNELMVILVTSDGQLPELTKVTKRLIKEIPEVKSFYWIINNRISDVVNYEKVELIFGEPFIREKLGDITFKLFPESFFQRNSRAALLLYRKIVDLLGLSGKERVLGLYCGAGPIEIFLSPFARKVIGVDSNEKNILNAKKNCELNKIRNCEFLEREVEHIDIEHWTSDIGSFDALVIDPPRAGISPKGMKTVLRLKVPKIVYVSCNPATLARDLKILSEEGYKIKKVAPFDLFPHTGHLESLTVLER